MNPQTQSFKKTFKKSSPRATYVDLDQFMGDWYLIAHLPTPFELDANNAIESFRWNEKDQHIDIDFHFYQGNPEGKKKSYLQKAWILDHSTNAEWRVHFFWPFRFSYLILDLAPDYTWALVGTGSKNFVWILARKPHLDEDIYTDLVTKLEVRGYDISRLRKVPQIWGET
ncbi:MAG: lipocalin family protein [Pseudobdellovibrionaceae bacterium]